jgi:uncharacterized protein
VTTTSVPQPPRLNVTLPSSVRSLAFGVGLPCLVRAWWARLCATLLALSVLFVVLPAAALDVPPLRGRVNDVAALLSKEEHSAIEQRLAAFEQQTKHQFALLTIASLEGEAIEDYSMRVAEAWKLGDAQKDDGLILLVVVNDRKARIEVGYGLEGDIPDALAGRVIRDVLVPRFRQGAYGPGIIDAFDVLTKAAGGEGRVLPERPAPARRSGGPSLPTILAAVVIALLALFGRGRGGGAMAGMLLGSMMSQGSRGGGGGGYRGRGGGFGGGGASGGW